MVRFGVDEIQFEEFLLHVEIAVRIGQEIGREEKHAERLA